MGNNNNSNAFSNLFPSYRSKLLFVLFLIQLFLVLYFIERSHEHKPPVTAHHHHHQPPETRSTNKHYFVVIGILSDRVSSARRDAVRETWLRFFQPELWNFQIVHKFVIGQPKCILEHVECDKATLEQENDLQDEEDIYHDLLRVGVLESYNTLSEKTCALTEWAASLKFDYLLKTDHDIFLRLDTLLSELKKLGPRRKYWSGFVWKNIPPISDMNDKNRDLVFDLGKFPPYTAGALHILSSDLVYGLSSELPRRYYQNEDQSLGIWLLPFNVTPIHDPRIQQWDVCHPAMIVKHPLTPSRMREMYGNIIRSDDMCRGFQTDVCPLCWECPPQQVHWRAEGLLECDEYGATLRAATNDRQKVDPALTDKVMAGVLGYLPYITCPRRKLEDLQLPTNLVVNGHLDKPLDPNWRSHGLVDMTDDEGLYDYASVTGEGTKTETAVKLSLYSSRRDASLIYQEVLITQDIPEALVISAWSRAVDVEATESIGDYSLKADFTYNDNTHFWGFTVDFPTGTHDWVYNVRAFLPEKPVVKVELYAMVRSKRGTVWFDNISVSKLSDQLCDLKHQSMYYTGFAPATLTPTTKPPPVDRGQGLIFIVIWTTPPSSFRLRHRRVIESIFFHHPDAHVRMYSNTLPLYFFRKFNDAGYSVEVLRYDLSSIGVGLPGEQWVRRTAEWETGESYYAHLADYLRFVLLFRDGGVYTDMDSILIKPIDRTNVIGVEHCDQDNLAYCTQLPQFPDGKKYYLPIGFLVLGRAHPILYECLSFFDTIYNPELWPCGTVYLTMAYTKLALGAGAVMNTNVVEILPREAFYPVPWQEVLPYFTNDDVALWNMVTTKSYAFHVWGKMTSHKIAMPGSLMYRVLNSFSISNDVSEEMPL